MATSTAAAQSPAACQPDTRGAVDFAACVRVAAPGSPERSLSLLNLGTQAFLQQDYASAVRYYDAAVPAGQKVFSDVRFHAFRGAAYERVGRLSDAAEDADVVARMIAGAGGAGTGQIPPQIEEEALAHALPILKRAGNRGYTPALARFSSIPASDWISHANRAAVLTELEEFEGALAANDKAMSLAGDHPQVLNTACYLKAKVNRVAEGLGDCQRAVAAAPEVAAIRDSYATALAALGRCREAEQQMSEARRLDPASVTYRRRLACAGS